MRSSDNGRMKRARKTPPATPPRIYVVQWIYALGSTPARVAQELDINEGYLSQLGSGNKANASIGYLTRIADHLGLNGRFDYFYRPPPRPEVISETANIDVQTLSRLRAPSKH